MTTFDYEGQKLYEKYSKAKKAAREALKNHEMHPTDRTFAEYAESIEKKNAAFDAYEAYRKAKAKAEAKAQAALRTLPWREKIRWHSSEGDKQSYMKMLQDLEDYGADVDEGLTRCMLVPNFYTVLVSNAATAEHLSILRKAIESNNLPAAYDSAIAMSSLAANLALHPLAKPLSIIKEQSRVRNRDVDYMYLLKETEQQMSRLVEIIDSWDPALTTFPRSSAKTA